MGSCSPQPSWASQRKDTNLSSEDQACNNALHRPKRLILGACEYISLHGKGGLNLPVT